MSGSTKVVSTAEQYLDDTAVETYASMTTSVGRILAGRAAFLHSFATGDPLGSPSLPIAVNPQGTLGHDHSGPPYGSAPRHAICWMAGLLAVPASWTRQNEPSFGGSADNPRLSIDLKPWVRPFQQVMPSTWTAPYSRGYVYLRYYSTTTGAPTITVRMRHNDGNVETETFAAAANLTENSKTLTAYFRLAPGINSLRLNFSSSSTTIVTKITALAICQIVKRSHT